MLGAPQAARADDRPLEIGVVMGAHFFSDTSALGRSDYAAPGSELAHSFAVGGRLGYGLSKYFLIEGEFLAMPTGLAEKVSQVLAYSGRGHLLFRWPLGAAQRWQPFLLAGGGIMGVHPDPGLPLHTENLGMFDAGLGLRVNVHKYIGLRVEGRMVLVPEIRTATFTQDWEALGSIYGRIGFGTPKKSEAAAAPAGQGGQVVPPKPVDSDGDGIPDTEDKCPNQAGIKENDGCPDKDTDGDSVVDRLDKCPDKAGPVENNGCPDVDTDGDGVLDRLDKCPEQAGPKDNNGCPDLDSDGDGIPDRLDKCPYEPETVNNYQDEDGCPDEVPGKLAKFVGKVEGIRFTPNQAVLLPQSFGVLDQIAQALAENPAVRIEIAGHTDNVGVPADNQALSQHRADAVKKYLEQKGISASRITAVGYGSTRPIADNATPAGRLQNRRVEFQLLPAGRGAPATSPPQGAVSPESHPAAPLAATPAAPVPAKLAQYLGKVEGIRFAPNQPVLLPQSFAVLDKIAEAMQEAPSVQLEISGHTDNVGVPAENQTLSQQRADAVKKYLEQKGVQSTRLIAVGYGQSKPIADNATPAGRAQNRRVEFRVVSSGAGSDSSAPTPSDSGSPSNSGDSSSPPSSSSTSH